MKALVSTTSARHADSIRKDAIMTRILAFALIFAVSLSTLSAANPYVHIEDTGIDYEDTELEEAYIGLDMVDGELVVILSHEAFEGALPAIAFEVSDLPDREDFWGEEFNADISNISEIRWHGVNDEGPHSAYVVGYDARHTYTTVRPVLEAYETAFGSMGFATEVRDTVAQSLKHVTFTNGDATVEGRFHGRAGGVWVELRSN